MIELKEVFKSYGSNLVLDGINLRFEKGKVYGIVGANGAGKTTMFKCITGLEYYDGEISSDIDPLKDRLGFLPTIPFIFRRITGREYLQLHSNARRMPQSDFDHKNIFDLPLEQYATNYSTGMKKKLALTAILLQENEVYILDEPFNGVDIQSNMVISEIIHQLRILGKTILISSHIFSTLERSCDIIHLLNGGKISRSVNQSEFADLEKEMKTFTIGNLVDRLELK